MFCSQCGKQIKDGIKFCPYCGSKVQPEESQPAAAPVRQSSGGRKAAPEAPRQPAAPKKKKHILPVLCVLVVLIALFAGGFYAYQSGLLDGVLEKISVGKDIGEDPGVLEEDEEEEDEEDEEEAPETDGGTTAAPEEEDAAAEGPSGEAAEPAVAEPYNSQEIRVVCSGSSAELSLYEWQDGEWIEVMTTHAEIGSNGISAQKQEGDRCTPAGTFDVLFCFSNRSLDTNLPCIQVQKGDVWVCDPDSAYYNTLQSSSDPGKDWDASENMYDKFNDSRSVACIYFAYNGDGQTAGTAVAYGGSALFLDGVGSSGNMTSGYGDIKIAAADMTALLGVLDAEKHPLIIIS